MEISGIQARPWLSFIHDGGSILGMLSPPSCPGMHSGVSSLSSQCDPRNPVPPAVHFLVGTSRKRLVWS